MGALLRHCVYKHQNPNKIKGYPSLPTIRLVSIRLYPIKLDILSIYIYNICNVVTIAPMPFYYFLYSNYILFTSQTYHEILPKTLHGHFRGNAYGCCGCRCDCFYHRFLQCCLRITHANKPTEHMLGWFVFGCLLGKYFPFPTSYKILLPPISSE